MRRILPAITRRGPAVLAAGCGIGLIIPMLADLARPLLSAMVFIFVLGTLLRVNNAEVLKAARDFKISLIFPLSMVVACPYAVGTLVLHMSGDPQLSLAVAISLAAPPASGNAAVARMLGLDPSMSLVTALCSMLIIPITAPLILHAFAVDHSVSMDPVDLAWRLAVLIGGAEGVAILIRRFSRRFVAEHGAAIDGVVVVALFLFAVGTMAGMQQAIVAQPSLAISMVAVAYGVNFFLQGLIAMMYPGTRMARFTMALNGGNRNVGLLWAALGASVSPTMALYFACCQLPIHTMPKILQFALPRIEKCCESLRKVF